LNRASSRESFLDAFQKRGERLLRASTFSLGQSKRIFSEHFLQGQSLSDLEFSERVLSDRFQAIQENPITLHEAGFLLRSLPKILIPSDQMAFFNAFKTKLESFQSKRSGAYKDLEKRLNQAIERLISKNPDLKKTSSPSFWDQLKQVASACGRVFRKVTR